MTAPEGTPETMPARPGKTLAKPAAPRRGLSPWWHLLTAIVVLALVQGFVAKLYQVPSGSMEQTLQVGDRIVVNRLAYLGGPPERGDVIVFTATEAWDGPVPPVEFGVGTAIRWIGGLVGIGPGTDHTLVKRVIGLPGDIVSCCDAMGRVLVNGEPIEEPYVFGDLPFEVGELDCTAAMVSPRCFADIEVPSGSLLVLGDHRSASGDSVVACRGSTDASEECARFVAIDHVVGAAALIVWPFSRFGGVER